MRIIIALLLSCFLCANALGANIYLRSGDGDNTDNGSTWALAKATLQDDGGDGALTAAGDGGTIWMSSNHAESTAGDVTLLTSGTVNAITRIISVDDTGSTPPVGADLLAGGSVTSTGGTGDLAISGYQYYYGVDFTSSDNIEIPNVVGNFESTITMETCTLTLSGTADDIIMGSGGEDVLFNFTNGTIDLSAGTANEIIPQGGVHFKWTGGSLVGAPLQLFDTPVGNHTIHIRDVDLSSLSGILMEPRNSQTFSTYLLERCKINAGLTILEYAIKAPAYVVRLHSCDSENTTYRYTEEYYEGTNTQDTGIYRTGGSTDGSTPISQKMDTNSNAIEFLQPLISMPIAAWTDATGSTNYDIEILIDSATTLNNDDVWVEFERPGSDAQGVIESTKMSSILGTPSELTVSSESWTGAGGSEKKYRLRSTFTPGKVGPITARVYLAKPDTIIYVDMKITEN